MMKKCPKCKKGELDTRVKRSFLVKTFLFWKAVKRYKCNYCGKSSYVYYSSKTPVTA